jgi:hypothetical protein
MRGRDARMINTRPPWAQPWTHMMPVRASSNTSFIHRHDSHGMTLPGVHSGVRHNYHSLRSDLRWPGVRYPHRWPPRPHVPCRQPHKPLLPLEPHRHADHFAHDAYTLLRSVRRCRIVLTVISSSITPMPTSTCPAHGWRRLGSHPRCSTGPLCCLP